jgi:tartrate dehydrogenase/decarboxylase/D-malate dehydrogenase
MTAHRVAVIAGDGIGKEVMPEGIRGARGGGEEIRDRVPVGRVAMERDYYAKHGRMMPEDWFEQIHKHDAIFFGAVGWPATVPDHISLWGSLIQWRRGSTSTSTCARAA